MTHDRLDREAQRLFDAARRELPTVAARERTLAAFVVVPHERRQRVWRWWVVGGVAAGFAIVLWLVPRSTVESPPIGPEGRTGTPSSRLVTASPSPKLAAPDDAERTLVPQPPIPSARRQPTPAPAPSVKLEDELRLLDDARGALASGDAAAALALLDRHRALPQAKSLAAEATLLRIQALSNSGRTAEAAALAQSFIASDPNGPLADRARRFIEPTGERP